MCQSINLLYKTKNIKMKSTMKNLFNSFIAILLLFSVVLCEDQIDEDFQGSFVKELDQWIGFKDNDTLK